jgi:hypothetical protein
MTGRRRSSVTTSGSEPPDPVRRKQAMKRVSIRWMTAAAAVTLCVLVAGCGGRKVENVDPTTEGYISGRWNDSDAQAVADELVPQALDGVWLEEFHMEHGDKPRVVVGQIVNETNEHLNVDVFMNELQRVLVNSGSVRFVADESVRASLMDEVEFQREMARGGGVAPDVDEGVRGADFMMMGTVSQIVDQADREAIVFYQVDLNLIDLRTWEKVWYGTAKRKHLVSGSNIRF